MQIMNRLAELTEDWEYLTKRQGFRTSLPLILVDIARLPYRHLRFKILARSLLDPFPVWQPKIRLSIRPFELDDLDVVRQIDRPSEANLCARRLDQGHRGLIAFFEGRPAGYSWGSTDTQTQLERVHLELDPGDVLCSDAFTAPAFRGQGIQTALTLARFHLFRYLGCRRAVSYIEVRNIPSLAVWERKFNSQRIGTIDFTRIGSWSRVRYT